MKDHVALCTPNGICEHELKFGRIASPYHFLDSTGKELAEAVLPDCFAPGFCIRNGSKLYMCYPFEGMK